MTDLDYNIAMVGKTEAEVLQAHARLIARFGSTIRMERKVVKTSDGYVLQAITTDTSDGMFQAITRELKAHAALSVEGASQREIMDAVASSAGPRQPRWWQFWK